MGAPTKPCDCCRKRVPLALIADLKVQKPVCLDCYHKRIAERKTYPVHVSRGLPPKHSRVVRL